MQYLTAIGEDNKYIFAVTMGAIFNVILNIVLIPKLYSYGAAIATVVAELIILILLMYFSRRSIEFKVFLKTFFKYLIGALLMYCISSFIKLNTPVVTIIVRVLISVIFYSVYLLLIRDKILYEIGYSVFRTLKNSTMGGNNEY